MQYREGTADVENGSAVVTGEGTGWLANAAAGDLFTIVGDGVHYEIAAVVSDTELILSAPYAGATASGASYAVSRDFTPERGYPLPHRGDVEVAGLVRRAFAALDAERGDRAALDEVLAEYEAFRRGDER